jgi:hypothetical protein
MAKRIRAFVLSSTILAMLFFSAVGTITVHADDGSGTETASEETTGTSGEGEQPTGDQTDVVDPAGDGGQPTDVGTTEGTPPADGSATTDLATGDAAPPADGSVTTDLATGDTAPATDGVPPTEETAPVTATEPILEQVPDNTTVTVLNTEGEAMPLVSQEAAEAIASDYDPIWCPAGQSPTPGANGCTDSYASFDELLNFLQANQADVAYQQAGTIYIQQGQYPGSESSIDFNNYDLNTSQNYDLTLQGGWDTVDNSVDPADTTSFDIPVIIGSSSNPWIGSLTLNNINIDGVLNDTGLTLYTEGDITLSNVAVTDSQSGADLNAGDGVDDDVTVSDSEFNNNEQGGVKVKAGGKVTINNSKFNGNSSSNQDGYGLNVQSGATVSLSQVSANNNELYGADITANGDVTVTASFFSGNQSYAYVSGWQYEGFGLQVTTTGNIDLDGVTANDNYLFGANLTGANVDVANSSFSDTDSDWPEHPTGYGLQVESTAQVTLAGVTANNNQLFGADIHAADAVSVTDSFFNGNQSFTYSSGGDILYNGYGIQIITDREVSLVNVEAEENYLFGAHIEGKDVAIDGGRFSNNGSGNGLDLTGFGLEVISEFSVALANVTANNNQLFGADIVATTSVAIENSSFSGHLVYAYDYFSGDISNRDGGYGLNVVTTGEIALEDVKADNNYLYGAYLQGDDIAVEGNLGISSFSGNGSGVLEEPPGNGFGYGLQIVSTGSVSLANVNDANSVGNQLFGVDITAEQNVTIVDSFFSGNQSVSLAPGAVTFFGYGLNVVTQGDVALNGVVANFNQLWGGSLTGHNVFVYNSQFNNNISDSTLFIDDTGLIVNASGFVDLYRVEAKENRLIGATITAAGDVFIAESTFIDNRGFTCLFDWCPADGIVYHGYGLQVTTPGLIQVTSTNASDNNLFGAQLNGGVVTVTDSTFNDNRLGDGLIINATDNVTLTNVTAVNNGGDGIQVTSVCGKIVQVTGGTFTDNDLYGIRVINSTLNLDGTQVFANNGSGNVFTQGACAMVTNTTTTNANTPAFVNGSYTGDYKTLRNHRRDKGLTVFTAKPTSSVAFVNVSYSNDQQVLRNYTHRVSRKVANHDRLMFKWVRGMA